MTACQNYFLQDIRIHLAGLSTREPMGLCLVKEGLWWVPCTDDSRMAIRQVLCLGSLGVSLAALEGRLIFPVFGQYILLHPPWNYLLVTLALYGFAAITIVYFSGDSMKAARCQETFAPCISLCILSGWKRAHLSPFTLEQLCRACCYSQSHHFFLRFHRCQTSVLL